MRFLAALAISALWLCAIAPAGETREVSVERQAERADLFNQRRFFRDAVGAADAGLRSSPAYLPLWRAKSRAHFELKEYDRAEESLKVWLTGDPDSGEATTLLLRTLLKDPDASDEDRTRSISRLLRSANPRRIAQSLEKWAAGDESYSPELVSILDSILADDSLAEPEKEIVKLYRDDGAIAAGSRMAGMEPAPDFGRYSGFLRYMLGRDLGYSEAEPQAVPLLEQAIRENFLPADCARIIRGIHLGANRRSEAADSLLPYWRLTENPARAVSEIAGDLIAANRAEEALKLLDEAAGAYPRMASLQAKRLLALHVLGREKERAAFEKSLADGGSREGLGYGRALIARAGGDYAAAEKELAEVVDFVQNVRGNSLDYKEIENWLEFWQKPIVAGEEDVITALYNTGGKLWVDGDRARSTAAWGKSFERGSTVTRQRVLAVAARMYGEKQGAVAEKFLRRHLPEVTPLDIAAEHFAEKRWYQLQQLSEAGALDGAGRGAWPSLFKTLAAIHAGSEDNPPDLPALITELGAHAPGQGAMPYRVVAKDESIDVKRLIPADYGEAMQELVAYLVQNQRDDIYPILLESPQWKEGGVGPAYIGRALYRTGQRKAAAAFYDRLSDADRKNPEVALALAQMAVRDDRPMRAAAILNEALPRAKGILREQMFALSSRLDNDREGSAKHTLAAFKLDPKDDSLRLDAIVALIGINEYDRAEALAEHFERRRLRGVRDVISYLAQARMELGEYRRAVPLWRLLRKRYPKSIPAIAGLARAYNEIERPDLTVRDLSEVAKKYPTIEITSLMAEANAALTQPKRSLEWVDLGLVDNPEDLRLLNLAARACETMNDYAGLERYACRYLKVDPEAVSMHVLYGEALMNQEKWDRVKKHNKGLLKKNPLNWAALEREEARMKALKDIEGTWLVDKYIAEQFPNDASLIVRAAISAAGAGKFRYAIPALDGMMKLGPNSSTLTLYFSQVTHGFNVESIDWLSFLSHIDMISVGHRYAGAEAWKTPVIPGDCAENVPVVLTIGRTRKDMLWRIDNALEAREGRAVLVIGEESLGGRNPSWADAETLRALAATGRWEFLLTDHAPPRYPGRCDGQWTNFWTQRRWFGDRRESVEEMTERITARMRYFKKKAADACVPVKGWVHPNWGDYGQRLTMGDEVGMNAYLCSVGNEFDVALTQTPSGYRTPETDRRRIPMRAVGRNVMPGDLWYSTAYAHPTRRAVLELAKVKSWHGQLPEANRLFCLARTYFTDPKEYSYFQSRNFQFMGDVPWAVALSHEARSFDPANPRIKGLIQDTHRLMRPLLEIFPRHWNDSNKEKYYEADANFSFHVNPKWELRFRVGTHHFKHPDFDQAMTGVSVGAGARYYFKPMNWVQAEVRGVALNRGVGTIPEAKVTWHGGFTREKWRMNGTFDLVYSHEMIETFKAVQKKITANRFLFNTSFRYRDWWDVDFQLYHIRRSDGNNTIGTMFRPMYRIKDIPLFKVGYWFAAADSGENPDEYYAPVDYQSHQLVAMYQQTFWKKLTVNAMGSWGMAHTRSNGWGNVLRGNFGVTYRPNECVTVGAGYSHLKLPDYTMNSMNMNISIRF